MVVLHVVMVTIRVAKCMRHHHVPGTIVRRDVFYGHLTLALTLTLEQCRVKFGCRVTVRRTRKPELSWLSRQSWLSGDTKRSGQTWLSGQSWSSGETARFERALSVYAWSKPVGLSPGQDT